MTPTTPAMTAQELPAEVQKALICLRADDPRVVDATPKMRAITTLQNAIVDAERRATEAEKDRDRWKQDCRWAEREMTILNTRGHIGQQAAESRLSAVEARCGLMREALESITLTRLPIEKSIAAAALAADSILAYPGGKSDQGEKERPPINLMAALRDAVAKSNPPAGKESRSR